MILATAGGRKIDRLLDGVWLPRKGALAAALARWQALPEEERKPGALRLPDLGPKEGDQWLRTCNGYRRTPPGTMVLKVFVKALEPTSQGDFRGKRVAHGQKDMDVFRDIFWLTEPEWKALVPKDSKRGGQLPLPRPASERLARFCLNDKFQCDNSHVYNSMPWRREDIRTSTLTLTVDRVSEREVSMVLTGDALAATDSDPAQARRGYRGRLLGYLAYDRKNQTFTRFDLVAVGETLCKDKRVGALPERLTVGVALELVPANSAFQEVFPAFVLYTADYKEYQGQGGGK